jgi:UDP-glucose 4-epimerase
VREANVLGSMQLFAACQRAPDLRRVVFRSTAAVYGSSPRDPAMFTEETGAKVLPQAGIGADCLEVEGYARSLARHRPDVAVVALRLADLVGSGVVSPLVRYFELPVLPMVLGFDPRLQFLHVDDAVRALREAVSGSAVGAVNVAGGGVITLAQAAALAGKPLVRLPGPVAGKVGRLAHGVTLRHFSAEQAQWLRYGRVLDTTRMREVLGLAPQWTTRAAFTDFARSGGRGGPVSADLLNRVERQVLLALAHTAERSGGGR